LACSNEVSPEVNAENNKQAHIFMSPHQNAGQNQNLVIANKLFEIAAQLKYLGMTLISQNYILEEIQSALHSENDCYSPLQNTLTSLSYKGTQVLNYMSKNYNNLYKISSLYYLFCAACSNRLSPTNVTRFYVFFTLIL
jgi:Zn-finger domain-containing protein